MARTTTTNATTAKIEQFDTKHRDNRGRVIGAQVATWEVDVVYRDGDAEGDLVPGYNAPGHYFVFRPWATRNGEAFGAVQHEQLFASSRDRDRAIVRYLKGAFARAAKVGASR